MEFLVALVLIVFLTFPSGLLLSKLHTVCTSRDFADNDAYFAHLEKRDRFIQEEHMGLSALNTILAVVIAAWFFGSVTAVLWPTVTLALGTFATWCLLKLIFRNPHQIVRWDGGDMSKLLVSLFVGIAAAIAVSVALTLSLFGLWSVSILVIAWLCLFPI